MAKLARPTPLSPYIFRRRLRNEACDGNQRDTQHKLKVLVHEIGKVGMFACFNGDSRFVGKGSKRQHRIVDVLVAGIKPTTHVIVDFARVAGVGQVGNKQRRQL